ncbi:MAG: LysR family transcriptional regulator [Microbacteriaceae bacterium]|nr:LysR family transcriptional regulator [Microbacteriaceae bacterium]
MALLEERSVTHAASRVNLSQPAMSHALKRLRTLLGDELLVRQGGAMLLTPRAEKLIEPVRRALNESVRALNPPPFNPHTDSRTITLALTTSTAFVYGPLLRKLLDERAPQMHLQLQTGDLSDPSVYTANGVDAVLLSEGLRSPYARERLYDDHWVVLTSGDVSRDRTPAQVLEEEPHIRVATEGLQLRPYETLDREGVTYTVRQTVTDYLLIPHFLAIIRGVGLHRFQVASEFLHRDPLRMLPFPYPIAPLGIDIVWNPWLTDDVFKNWLRELMIEAAEPLQRRAAGVHYRVTR